MCKCCEEENKIDLTKEEIDNIIVERYNDKDEKTKVFIRKALRVHGDKFDYYNAEYTMAKNKITITCRIHGDFDQRANSHLNGYGCLKCANEGTSERCRHTKEEFINMSKELFGDKFDYSKINYITYKTPLIITCPIHGDILITPASHLNCTVGCPKCGIELRNKSFTRTTEEFIEEARKVHGNKYDYSKVNYVNCKAKVTIICPEHGEFEQTPEKHLEGCKCPKCSCEEISERFTSNTEEFIEKARKVHGDKYDYSKTVYINAKEKVTIICPEHGEFEQNPSNHLSGQECPKCSQKTVADSTRLTVEEFIKRAKEIHGDKYDYSKVNYINNRTNVIIICPEHGEFEQVPSCHLGGSGCPSCKSSIGELYVRRYLESNNYQFNQHDIVKIPDRRLVPDFTLKLNDKNIWIEYNGEQHYRFVEFFHHFGRSRDFNNQLNRDIDIRKYCKANGIFLVEIPYILDSYEKVNDFLDKVLIQNVSPNTLVNYSELYKLENTGLSLEDLYLSS